jgi:hypothetical protein
MHRGVEVLEAVFCDEGNAAHGLADPPLVDQLDRGLDRAAEEGVRCAADQHAGRVGRAQDLPGRLHAGRQRLLAPHVLAGGYGLEARGGMRERRRQIHDQFDLAIAQQLVWRARPRYAVLRRLGLGAGEIDVRARHDLEQL